MRGSPSIQTEYVARGKGEQVELEAEDKQEQE